MGVNRCGYDPSNYYNGYSCIYDPMGNEIISVSDEETVVIIDIYKDIVNADREQFPFLNDIKLI